MANISYYQGADKGVGRWYFAQPQPSEPPNPAPLSHLTSVHDGGGGVKKLSATPHTKSYIRPYYHWRNNMLIVEIYWPNNFLLQSGIVETVEWSEVELEV